MKNIHSPRAILSRPPPQKQLNIDKIVTQLREIEGDLFFYAVVIESTDDAIIQQNLDGVILSWNKGAERMYGYTAKEAISESIEILNPPELPEDLGKLIGRLQSGERIDHYETKRRRKNKSSVDVSITVWPVKNNEGTIVGASIIARDITDRNELASQTHMMSLANKELKSSITGLRGYLKALQTHLIQNGKNGLLPKVKKIDQQVAKLIELIDDLLGNVAAKKTAEHRYHMKKFSLQSVAQNSIEKVRASTKRKINFISEPLISLYGDPDRIEQVMTILLMNAVKFTPDEGFISVLLEKENEYARVSIQDSGIGISKDNSDKIFNPYYQVSNVENKANPGIGMGLSVAADIIHNHQGKLWLKSELGRGATFYFTLPLKVIHTIQN